MKELFNRRQRFSLRKYSIGVCSVLLGTALFAVGAPSVAADEAVSTSQPREVVAVSSPQAEASQSAPASTNAEGAEAPKDTAVSAPVAEEKATEATSAATETPEATAEKTEEAKPATEEVAKPEANKKEAEVAKPAAEAKPATDESNKPKVRSRRAVTNEAVSGDHNSNPVAVSTYLKDGEKVTPEIKDANGATVRSQTVPAGYSAKEGDWYTYAIWDLTRFNERYGTKYYARAYKRFDESTDTTVELIDKTTGNVVETRTVTSSSGVQKFTTTTAASNSELTFQVDYKAGLAQEKGKTIQPFIQNGYEVGKSITDLVAAGHQLTPAEQALHTAVYNARTTTDILNVVEPAYNGRLITDSNDKIPEAINKTTYYKVVDKNNP